MGAVKFATCRVRLAIKAIKAIKATKATKDDSP